MFNQDRNQMRKVFFDCWKAHRDKTPMDAMQTIIAHIIELHPEYHALLENEAALYKDYTPEQGETNPFLHMSMHIALHEQISTDRPTGIKAVYQSIIMKQGSTHDAEHAMMECLGEALWLAQRNNRMPDETAYLECLKNLS
ncbi:MAG: DUF1841 family protein [Gammaproteobacteria bacterium]|nr:DUF1841 family protein [Gammaproteobacteria bacterium]